MYLKLRMHVVLLVTNLLTYRHTFIYYGFLLYLQIYLLIDPDWGVCRKKTNYFILKLYKRSNTKTGHHVYNKTKHFYQCLKVIKPLK